MHREAVFELMDAVMGGKPAAALSITDRAYERGADLGALLQDLLDPGALTMPVASYAILF